MKKYEQYNPLNRRPRILAVVAHPDDESFLMGGTLARYAFGGVRVALLCLTHGESGYDEQATEDARYLLPRVRKAELARSCSALGVQLLPLLDFPDGKLAEVGAVKLAQPIANIIRLQRPDIVLTFGPEGLTGHPDHKAVHRAATRAFQMAAQPGAALFYGGLSENTVQNLSTRLEGSLDGLPLKLTGAPFIEHDTAINIHHTGAIKWTALQNHRSQAAGFTDLTPNDLQLLSQHEYFRLVQVAGAYAVRPAPLAGPAATDLFTRMEQSIPLLRSA
jgi:LmbE family N-acetylglucosaminyl deacetylase